MIRPTATGTNDDELTPADGSVPTFGDYCSIKSQSHCTCTRVFDFDNYLSFASLIL